MFAVYASKPNLDDPLAAVVVGERPEPKVTEGWMRVKVSHASLNRHDLFTLRGITAHDEPISYPMILGNDGAGVLDDGTEIVIYPVMGSSDWRGDETLDPDWHIFSERVQGTFADFVVVPRRNAIPRPAGISALDASVMGTHVRLEIENGHRFVPDVVEAFPGEIQALSVSKPTLEDVFIHRTGHKFWNEERVAPKGKKKKH